MAPEIPDIELSNRETLATEITRKLTDYLFSSGKVQPGDRLPSERQLASAFGIGRSAVREALKSLSLLGLVEIRQGSGTYLKQPDSDLLPQVIEWGLLLRERTVLDLVEARAHIEVITATLCAERCDEEGLGALRGLLDRMRRAGDDIDEFVAADVAFHLQVAESTTNSILSDILRSIQSLLRVWIHRVMVAAESPRPSYEEHAEIYRAIENKDSYAARAAMQAHMDRASHRLLATLEGGANERQVG